MRDELYRYWQALINRFDARAAIAENCFNDLVTHYSQPHRFYHNLKHILQLLRLYDLHASALTKKEVVLFSVFYHDVIYQPGRGDNEDRSADKAKDDLQKLGAPEEVIEEVSLYIKATKNHHAAIAKDEDLQYFLDFDLSILATDPEEYKTYTENVRKEYAYLSDEHFAWGRKAFVQNTLRLPHIFFTEVFRQREEAARRNLSWELDRGAQYG